MITTILVGLLGVIIVARVRQHRAPVPVKVPTDEARRQGLRRRP